MTRRLLWRLVALILAALFCACAYHDGAPARGSGYSSSDRVAGGGDIGAPAVPLTPSETKLAEQLATEELARRNLRTDARIYVVDTQLFRVKDGALAADRLAIVTHYRAEGDTTITSIVDLTARRVTEVRTATHVPTALSQEEFEDARQLALADAAVLQALGANREHLVIEPLPITTMSRDDPFFGHRVVRLLFRAGRQYLSTPVVVVDITVRRVIIEPPSRNRRPH